MEPKERTNDLLIEELHDELLVYDSSNHCAHCLNRAAADIWRRCDGERPIALLGQSLLDQGLSAAEAEEAVNVALALLHKAGLLEGDAPPELEAGRPKSASRRALLTAGIAVPAVLSIVIPTSAAAASCKDVGTRCTGSSCCRSLFCSSSICTPL